jgi:hypothetical protein
MDTTNGKEQPKMQEDDATKKKVKEEEAGNRNGYSSTDSVKSGSVTDYQIHIPIGWASW